MVGSSIWNPRESVLLLTTPGKKDALTLGFYALVSLPHFPPADPVLLQRRCQPAGLHIIPLRSARSWRV